MASINKFCYIQMGPWIIKETGHKKLERRGAVFDEVGGCIMWPRPICLSFLLHGPTTDFWSGPTFQILFVFYAGLNGQSLHVGSHVLCWVMYVVARRAEIAVDHIKLGQYLGRGAWKLRQQAQRIHTFLLELKMNYYQP